MTKPRKQLARYIAHRINLKSLDSSRPILQYIADHGRVTLSQVASALQLSRGTSNLHLQRLEHEQYIRRYESRRRGAGRPTVIWGWDEPLNLTLSLVFDVPFLHASIADFGLNAVLREARDLSGLTSRDELQAIVHEFATRARTLARQRGAHIRQTMIYLPGLLDPVSGVVRKAANFPLLEGMDFRRMLTEPTEAPCLSAPLGLPFYTGESEFLPPHANTMVIYWDLGVGVVFGHGDRLSSLGVSPEDGAPTLPELGHIRIEKSGRLCQCGRKGCLEAYTGGWALMDMLRRKTATRLGEYIRLVQHGDPEALRLAHVAAETLGRHLAWPLQLMRTDHIRVCGPMAPVFEEVATSFTQGLATILSQDEIKQLHIQVSPAREERFQRGAHRLARRLCTHQDDYSLLLRTPESQSGRV